MTKISKHRPSKFTRSQTDQVTIQGGHRTQRISHKRQSGRHQRKPPDVLSLPLHVSHSQILSNLWTVDDWSQREAVKPGQLPVKPERRRRAQQLDHEKLQLPHVVTPLLSANHSATLYVLFWRKSQGCCGRVVTTCSRRGNFSADRLQVSSFISSYTLSTTHSRCPHLWFVPAAQKQQTRSWERCLREVTPPAARPSRPWGGSLSTTLLTCPRITPRLLEGLCSALHQEVTHWGGINNTLVTFHQGESNM